MVLTSIALRHINFTNEIGHKIGLLLIPHVICLHAATLCTYHLMYVTEFSAWSTFIILLPTLVRSRQT